MRILVVRYRFIGDTILTVPFLRNLRRAYPYAKIDMLVGPVSGELLEGCPYLDNLIYFDTTKKHRYENSKPRKKSFFRYVKLLQTERYDKAYVLKRSLSSALLVSMAGIKERVGFDTEKRSFLLTKKVPYDKNKHEVESFLDVLRADGIEVKDDYLEAWLNPMDVAQMNELFQSFNLGDKKKVMVHATSGNTKKQWDKQYFAQVIEYLSNVKEAQVFYAGAQSDNKIYDEIHSLIETDLQVKPINLCGKLSLTESAVAIASMDLLFGNDSGNLHVAGALGIPTIGIYGPMDYKKWKVWSDKTLPLYTNLDCYPCNLRFECKNNYGCLSEITPEMAIDAIEKQLSV
ncbi:MAG: lipopolysaccharide heptosyltransferase II [Candidatus Gastranaerophilales bacterium]|nr:lipopolysaccharide heptosyltransferase II [Candidatus Gastranaerophilales bacterium]